MKVTEFLIILFAIALVAVIGTRVDAELRKGSVTLTCPGVPGDEALK